MGSSINCKINSIELGITLEKALAQEDDLRKRMKRKKKCARLIDLARKLEGITRNAGKQCSGVVIAPSVDRFCTAVIVKKAFNTLLTQFDKDDVEAVGLVKFDFLGLRTLTIIDWAVQANQ